MLTGDNEATARRIARELGIESAMCRSIGPATLSNFRTREVDSGFGV
jgi:magnesium-transporting ATPase (P-type)